MVETPTGGHQEAIGVLDILLGVSPVAFVVGLLTGLAASGCTYPLARRVDAGFIPSDRFGRRQHLTPMALGGVGLLASVWIAVATADVWRVDSVWWTLARNVLVGGSLAAPVQVLQYQDAGSERRRASRYVYTAFVLAWTAIASLLTVLLFGA